MKKCRGVDGHRGRQIDGQASHISSGLHSCRASALEFSLGLEVSRLCVDLANLLPDLYSPWRERHRLLFGRKHALILCARRPSSGSWPRSSKTISGGAGTRSGRFEDRQSSWRGPGMETLTKVSVRHAEWRFAKRKSSARGEVQGSMEARRKKSFLGEHEKRI